MANKARVVIKFDSVQTSPSAPVLTMKVDGVVRNITPVASSPDYGNWEFLVGGTDYATASNLYTMLAANITSFGGKYNTSYTYPTGYVLLWIDATQWGDEWTFNASVDNATLGLSVYSELPNVDLTPIVITAAITDNTCSGGATGAIDVTVSGGTAPYTYAWDDGFITTQDRTGLAKGDYKVTVTDSDSSVAYKTFTVGAPQVIVITAAVTNSDQGINNGSIVLSVSGGSLPYSFAWDDGPTTQNRSNLAVGTYRVVITDNNGCTNSATFEVKAEFVNKSVAFRLGNLPLDVDPNSTIGIDIVSPLIDPGKIYGSKIYNISFPITPKNQRLFGYPENLANTGAVQLWEDVAIYVHKLLWKTGTLKLRNIDSSYQMSFHSDSGEVQLKLANRTMPGLDLGTEAPNYQTASVYPTVNHIFFPVRNVDFYGDKNTDFAGYVNYYHSGAFVDNVTTNDYNRVPFPFLLYILDKTFKELGYYGIQGDWTTDAEIRKVVLYNNYAIDKLNAGVNDFDTTITYNRHVPDVGIGDFLIDVAVFFGITYIVNPKTGWVDVVRISDVLDATGFKDVKTGIAYGYEPNNADGYYFKQMADENDLLVELDNDWLTYQVGEGVERIETRASTVLVENDSDSIIARTWDIPVVQQQGSGPEFDLGLNRAPLRFMVYNGLQNDSLSNTYPQGHYTTPAMSLRWDDAAIGMSKNYDSWMAFKDQTVKVERELRMTIAEFLTTDITEKVMADKLKYLFGSIKASVSFKNGLGPVKAEMFLLR